MNYKEAMEYVESLQQYGRVFGLTSIQQLCEHLGNPQNELKFIHIAGTNGKGSVLAYISTVLQAAGYKVGRYISPTIFEYRERIQVNGKPITKSGLCRCLEQVRDATEQMAAKGQSRPTLFEVETAAAFLYFLEKKCDIVVLETGLGGRLDATNIIQTTVCAVFTSISMDHMAVLGKSLEKIAEQKSDIIKDNCVVVSDVQKDEVMRVIEKTAARHGAELLTVGTDHVGQIKYGLTKQRFSYGEHKNLEIAIPGQCQIENAVLAVEVLDALQKKGFPVSENHLRMGLLRTEWIGRFSIIGWKPLFIVDGAHNEDAALKLAESIRYYFANRRILYIMGMLDDKEHDKVIRATCGLAEHIVTVTPPHNARALNGYELAKIAKEHHNSVTVADSLQEAAEITYLLAGKDKETVIIAFGSLSYLGELIHIVEHRDTIRRDSHGRSEQN